jgi:GrpB-like predicted nucleotidyltransferase (UPF0157 family)
MVRADLTRILASVPIVGIEHVGSTSIPGLAAKPILDIDVIVARSSVAPAGEALEAAGYTALGEMGVPDRYAFRAPDDGIRRNVYVTVDGCLSLRNHLGLRSILRADAVLRDEYGTLKLRLSEVEYDDDDHFIAGYVADKSRLVRHILERAGLTPDELAEIDAINRL